MNVFGNHRKVVSFFTFQKLKMINFNRGKSLTNNYMGNIFENIIIEIISECVKIAVSEHTVNDQQIYRLIFSDDR